MAIRFVSTKAINDSGKKYQSSVRDKFGNWAIGSAARDRMINDAMLQANHIQWAQSAKKQGVPYIDMRTGLRGDRKNIPGAGYTYGISRKSKQLADNYYNWASQRNINRAPTPKDTENVRKLAQSFSKIDAFVKNLQPWTVFQVKSTSGGDSDE